MEQLSENFVFSCIQPRAQESHKGMEPSGNMVMALDTLARSGE